MNKPIFKHVQKGDRPSAKEYNRRGDLLAAIANSLHIQSFFDSTGFHTRRFPAGGVITSKIFAIQNVTDLGWGVYNCYEQSFETADWTSVAAGNRFANKNTNTIEVFNSLENYPVAGYDRALGRYDLLKAHQIRDDAGIQRWMGIPVAPPARRFITTEASPHDDSITCNIILNTGAAASSVDDIVFEKEVYGDIHGTTFLDEALPTLVGGGYLEAINQQGVWRCTTVFRKFYVCP